MAMITKTLAAACAALLLLAALLWWRMDAATERAATAEQTAQINAETAEAWRLALDAQTKQVSATDKLLTESRRAQTDLRTTTDRRLRRYENTLTENIAAHDWDLALVPAAVAERMCDYTDRTETTGHTLPETAGTTAPADAYPACSPTTGQLWRWAERLVEAVDSCNADKAAVMTWGGL